MKSQILIVLLISISLIRCDFRKPLAASKDPATGIITKPEGLSCDDVWLSIEEEKTTRVTFIYGEAFSLNFNNMEGFNKVDNSILPGMLLKVTDESGDTIMQTEDLYADSVNGINLSPLLLKANFAIQRPVYSDHKYSLIVKIWDKLGEGTLITEAPFSVIKNERINIEANYISCDEIYLFSIDRDKVIIDGSIYFNETIYLVFEGLSGFYESNGKVFPGSPVRAVDYGNNPILYFADLYHAYPTTGINSDNFKSQIYVKMKFTEGKVENPIYCEVTLFDKKRDVAHMNVTTELSVK